MELLGRQRSFLLQIRRVAQRRPCGAKSGKRQPQDALRRPCAKGDARSAQAAIDQQLREQPAKGMADDDRWLVELANDLVVVVDDVRDAEVSERRRISA